MNYLIPLRLKRLRRTHAARSMLQETELRINQFIAPLFISEKISVPQAIQSMPRHAQLPLSTLTTEVEELSQLGIQAVLLFGIPEHKDEHGSTSLKADGIIQQAIRSIKASHPNMLVIADVCFCEYTSHGHCGILKGEHIHNDATLKVLAEQAVSYAKAGVDWVAPSSMTDGMVHAIRSALDTAGFEQTAILSYAVKYSSAFYGPFREAAEGTPKFGDRKTYQMNPANAKEAIREARLDVAEGADILMVKPAQNYLDIIYRVKAEFPEIPMCAYQVSGEYAMIMQAAQAGLIEETAAMIESITAIKRAGADLIITYFAKALATYLKKI